MQLLERALAEFGARSEEGAAVLRALGSLAKRFSRPRAKELVPAQILELIAAQRSVSPIQSAMAQQRGAAPIAPAAQAGPAL